MSIPMGIIELKSGRKIVANGYVETTSPRRVNGSVSMVEVLYFETFDQYSFEDDENFEHYHSWTMREGPKLHAWEVKMTDVKTTTPN